MGKGNFVPIARRCASQSRAGTGIDGATVRAHTRSKSSLFPSLWVDFEFVFIHFESFSNSLHGIWEYLLLFALGPYPPAGAINSVGQDEFFALREAQDNLVQDVWSDQNASVFEEPVCF